MGYWLLSSNEIKVVQRAIASSIGGRLAMSVRGVGREFVCRPGVWNRHTSCMVTKPLLVMKPLLHAAEVAACVRRLGGYAPAVIDFLLVGAMASRWVAIGTKKDAGEDRHGLLAGLVC